ncbi:hypothetical protein ACC741_37385, partial [Rhizobium johnstonii]|uniref:hypothetical protein n=1 Tax=Rhizobium johnstonii TaxID=3019933 RepID=UPI003F951AC7
IGSSEEKDELWYITELYRLNGDIFFQRGDGYIAERFYLQSIELARQQDALSLELRGVMSLARSSRGRGDRIGARELLAAVYDRFSEGFDTADL